MNASVQANRGVGAHRDAPLQTVIGKRTAVPGRTLRGRVVATLYGGKVVWQA